MSSRQSVLTVVREIPKQLRERGKVSHFATYVNKGKKYPYASKKRGGK